MLTARTEYRHRMLQAPPRVKASSPYLWRHNRTRGRAETLGLHRRSVRDASGQTAADLLDSGALSPESGDPTGIPEGSGNVCEAEAFTYNVVDAAMSNAGQNWGHTIGDYESDEGESNDDDVSMDEDELGSGGPSTESSGLPIWEELGESLERSLAAICKFICIALY
jgi:hypothetical protein